MVLRSKTRIVVGKAAAKLEWDWAGRVGPEYHVTNTKGKTRQGGDGGMTSKRNRKDERPNISKSRGEAFAQPCDMYICKLIRLM